MPGANCALVAVELHLNLTQELHRILTHPDALNYGSASRRFFAFHLLAVFG
jgi:hypothetical protein